MKSIKLMAIIGILAVALWAPAAQADSIELIGDRVTGQLTTEGAYGVDG
ncbi:MAG: hypothetical protein KKF43_09725 [Proteobacteria bacterium]|nr:hypothetical protein [Pseudomonadota bacterium]